MCVISLFLLQTIAVMVLPYMSVTVSKSLYWMDTNTAIRRVSRGGAGPPPIEKKAFRFCPPPYEFLDTRLVKKQYQDAKYFLHCV